MGLDTSTTVFGPVTWDLVLVAADLGVFEAVLEFFLDGAGDETGVGSRELLDDLLVEDDSGAGDEIAELREDLDDRVGVVSAALDTFR